MYFMWAIIIKQFMNNGGQGLLDKVLKGDICGLWPLLLTWFNFNPSMDK